jgi:hypothetical protein
MGAMTTPDPSAPATAAPTHVYRHPAGHGLGRHHAATDLSGRNAQPPEVHQGMRSALGMVQATDGQRAAVEHFIGRSMHDLDMADGTHVADVPSWGPHDDGHELEWADQHGDPRRTHVTDAQFAEFFQPIGATA